MAERCPPEPPRGDMGMFSEALAGLLDRLVPIGEAVDGYRVQCTTRGYSPTAAESMAVELHGHLLRAAFLQAYQS